MSCMQACRSEMARIREEIAHEYMAAELGLYGLHFGISQQKVMTVHKEWIRKESSQEVGDETLFDWSKIPSKSERLHILQCHLGPTEGDTEWLCDRVEDALDTIYILIQCVGI